LRQSILDPYVEFIRQILDQHPRLRATRVYQMARDRGYTGSVVQLRRTVAHLRPHIREPFLRLQSFPGEQGQVDWAHFGHVMVGRARRALSCFVITLSYSRALYLEFFFDQTTENFLRGHVNAFLTWNGQPRTLLYDNLKSAVLERRGSQILFNPRLLELSRIITLRLSPAKCAPEIRRDAWNERSAMYAIPSGPAALSPRWRN
jgi:transposase